MNIKRRFARLCSREASRVAGKAIEERKSLSAKVAKPRQLDA